MLSDDEIPWIIDNKRQKKVRISHLLLICSKIPWYNYTIADSTFTAIFNQVIIIERNLFYRLF